MENVLVNADLGVLADAAAGRRSRIDDMVARHRQRRLEALALWAGFVVVVGSLLMV
jgi:hypothetical protein